MFCDVRRSLVFNTGRILQGAHRGRALGCGDPSTGLPASRLVASHFSVMVNHAQVMTAGPKVVGRALGYEITKEQLGGVEVHRHSGVVDNIVATEEDAFEHIRRFLRFGTECTLSPPKPPVKTTGCKAA